MVRKTTETDAFATLETLETLENPPTTTITTTPTFRALKLASEVQAALEQRYAGPTKEIQGFTYIPWNESTKEANRVFGYFGWSSSVLSVEYVDIEIEAKVGGTWQAPIMELKDFKGFKSIVRVSIQVLDDYTGQVITTHHDGVGYGTIQQQGLKDPMDTACKAAKSDGISTAIKHYGDAFGLYLYDKEEQTPQSTTNTTSTTTTNTYKGQATSSNGARTLSEKQVNVLLKRCGGYGLTQDVIEQTDFPTLKAVLDDLFNDVHPRQAMSNHGLTPASTSGTGDRLPIPADR